MTDRPTPPLKNLLGDDPEEQDGSQRGTQDVTRALTLWPEWAWACVHLGKDVENRSYPPPGALVGRSIALHAGTHVGGVPSRRSTQHGLELMAATAALMGWDISWKIPAANQPIQMSATRGAVTQRSLLITRAILGVFSLRALPFGETPSRWQVPGQVPWSLRDLRLLRTPVVNVRGYQGIWRLRSAEAGAVTEALELAS